MFDRSIETSVDIAASPEHVWRVLTSDGLGSSSWNPFITGFEGQLTEGQRLTETVKPPDKSAATFKPTLVLVTPGKELCWRGSLPIPGLFTGEHYFRIDPPAGNTAAPLTAGGSTAAAAGATVTTAPGGCRLVHGERFSGLLLPAVGGMLVATEAGFVAMNEALKQAAEAAPGSGS